MIDRFGGQTASSCGGLRFGVGKVCGSCTWPALQNRLSLLLINLVGKTGSGRVQMCINLHRVWGSRR